MKNPQATVGSTLDPGFRVWSTIHQNCSGRNPDGEVEAGTARFLGIAGFVVFGILTATRAIVVAIVRIEVSVYCRK